MRLYTKVVGGVFTYICEMKIGLDIYIGQSTICPREARRLAMQSKVAVNALCD